jgi:hypothetical protein
MKTSSLRGSPTYSCEPAAGTVGFKGWVLLRVGTRISGKTRGG